jgi:hypothetical protein
VKNPNGVCKGVRSVTIDGKKVAGINGEAKKRGLSIHDRRYRPIVILNRYFGRQRTLPVRGMAILGRSWARGWSTPGRLLPPFEVPGESVSNTQGSLLHPALVSGPSVGQARTGCAATSQDILELRRRKCNKSGIAKEFAPWLNCPTIPTRAFLTRVYLALP